METVFIATAFGCNLFIAYTLGNWLRTKLLDNLTLIIVLNRLFLIQIRLLLKFEYLHYLLISSVRFVLFDVELKTVHSGTSICNDF